LDEDCTVKQLTKDHNLKDPDERKRIIEKGGRIEPFRDRHGNPHGPERIWLQNQAQPGLVMTRSFGDHLAHSVGCSPYPELFAFKLGKKDRMLVVASDGVWEFLSNLDVAKIVYPIYLQDQAEEAAEALLRAALEQWSKVESGIIDDITLIVVFLK